MSRSEAWAGDRAIEFLIFMQSQHNAGVSISEIAGVFNKFDEDEPESDTDFMKRTKKELLL